MSITKKARRLARQRAIETLARAWASQTQGYSLRALRSRAKSHISFHGIPA